MFKSTSIAATLLTSLLACKSTTATSAERLHRKGIGADSVQTITITVITAADNTTRLPGADVDLIQRSGQIENVGRTDQFGVITIRRNRIESDAVGVMVCHPVFYCGVLRSPDLTRRTDVTIALATRVIR
jgi:hypothetical protein